MPFGISGPKRDKGTIPDPSPEVRDQRPESRDPRPGSQAGYPRPDTLDPRSEQGPGMPKAIKGTVVKVIQVFLFSAGFIVNHKA